MREEVKNYYGKVLAGSQDLQTNACCTDEFLPEYVKSVLANIHSEVMNRYFGCGLVIPEQLMDCDVLDLGCGAGRDCYALAQLVGANGSVLGVDMTDEQLTVARRYAEYHQKKFSYSESNVNFKQGYIENLNELNLPDENFDAIVSNCVINLSTDKEAVLKEAFRLLKNGGEVYFSDVYSDRRIPQNLVDDPLLYGECLSGALYLNDFIQLATKVGFVDPRLVTARKLTIGNNKIIEKVGAINFYSITFRLFKSPDLELTHEDYGLKVIYKGTLAHFPEKFKFDQQYEFATGVATKVCGNTWKILANSRFSTHFEWIGDFDEHYGAFNSDSCLMPIDTAENTGLSTTSGCC